MEGYAQLIDCITGRAFRPDPADPTVPLARRLAGERLLVVVLTPAATHVHPVRLDRKGHPHPELPFPLPAPPDALPDPAWAASLRRRHPARNLAILRLATTDTAWRRAVNFAAPPGLFGSLLASRPEVIAGPLPPGRTVTGFRDPLRPVALLAEGPDSLVERTTAATAAHGLTVVRIQDLLLAALECLLRRLPDPPPGPEVAVHAGDVALTLPLAPDGTWGEPGIQHDILSPLYPAAHVLTVPLDTAASPLPHRGATDDALPFALHPIQLALHA